MKSVVFIGHDDCYGLDRDVLHKIIINCIEKGATLFFSGGQGGFDRACAVAVYKVKKEYPHIRNILVIPYLHFNVFNDEYFDEIVFTGTLDKCYFKAAIPKRNKYMVDNADAAICYVGHGWGNAIKTLEYAKGKNLEIINLLNYK